MAEEIILKDGYFIRRTIVESRVMSQEEALRAAVGNVAYNLYNLAMLGNEPVHGLIGPNTCLLYSRIRELPFHTYFELATETTGADWLYPCWHDKPGSVNLKATFKIPDLIPTYFCEYFDAVGGTRNTLFPRRCHLITVYKKEIYNLPYPNIFDDGHVCMGQDWDRRVGRIINGDEATQPLVAEFAASFMTFNATAMNEHLVKEATYNMFKYNATTKEFAANKADECQLAAWLRICANSTFSKLVVP